MKRFVNIDIGDQYSRSLNLRTQLRTIEKQASQKSNELNKLRESQSRSIKQRLSLRKNRSSLKKPVLLKNDTQNPGKNGKLLLISPRQTLHKISARKRAIGILSSGSSTDRTASRVRSNLRLMAKKSTYKSISARRAMNDDLPVIKNDFMKRS